MNKLQEMLNIKESSFNIKLFLLLLLAAYFFSIAIRMIWIGQFSGVEQFYWNDQIMINTNDGYYYAEGARDNLEGSYQKNDRSPIESPLSQITSIIASVLPMSFESLILYMSSIFGSLLVVPIMLIARALKQDTIGLIAALIGGIAWSYYNRTMTGYYDTDMLVIVLPVLVLYGVILAATSQRNRYLVLITISMMLNHWWYPGSYSLNMAMIAIVLIYTLIYERKNVYFYKILLFMAIAVVVLPFLIKALIALTLFLWFHFKQIEDTKIVFSLLGVAALVIMFSGGLGPILSQLDAYVFRSVVTDTTGGAGLHFFNVAQTVREAGQIPFETFANRISGHTITFVLSTIGYVMLALRYPVMWLALPMIGLGFLALKGGLRFTVYAVPINALGVAYLIVWFSQKISGNFKYIAMAVLTALILYPNITHVIDYKVPTVFNKQEVQALDTLRKVADREDYVLAWWDYGYPLRYYSDVKTLIDGGKHNGDTNYPVSFALFENQLVSSKMARLAVEYTESAFKEQRSGSYIQMMMDDNNISDPNDFLLALSRDAIDMPKKTRDVYYYLPLRMMDILPTVGLFSNLDLSTGKQLQNPFFYQSTRFQQTEKEIDLGSGVKINLQNGQVTIGTQVVPINTFYISEYDENGQLKVSAQVANAAAPMSVIYMKSYNRFLVLDQKMLNSTYIQLFVLGNYDKNLFELTISDPLTKIYKLKI